MCVIIHQRPGLLLPYEMFQNACWNNPDGYGIVIKDNGRLQVIKKLDPKGNDPEEIYKIVSDNKDVERFIHLRHKTVGSISEQNVQPFTVYSSKDHQIEFMHNGTLNIHYPESELKFLEASDIKVDSEASDTQKFAVCKLAPLLLRFRGEKGHADFNDPFFRTILNNLWPNASNGNRGILISSREDTASFVFNSSAWKEISFTEDGKEYTFSASNDDYFKRLVRGPKYEAEKKLLEEASRAEREKRIREGRSAGDNLPLERSLVKLASPPFLRRYKISELPGLGTDKDYYTEKGLAALSGLEYTEIDNLIKNKKDDFIFLFMALTSAMKEMLEAEKEQGTVSCCTNLIHTARPVCLKDFTIRSTKDMSILPTSMS